MKPKSQSSPMGSGGTSRLGDETTKRMLLTSTLLSVTLLALVVFYAPEARADSKDCTISLQPSKPSPQLVGERIVWTSTAANCGKTPVYQFKVASMDDQGKDDRLEDSKTKRQFRLARDFSPDNSFAWVPIQEGDYEVQVSVKEDFSATSSTSAVVPDSVNSRVTGSDAVVNSTVNPLVALYSAPPCSQGTIVVKFRPAASSKAQPWTRTNTLDCVPGKSRNFLVAGMLANTAYEMVDITSERSFPPLLFTTGAPPSTLDIPSFTVRQEPGGGSDSSTNMVYHNLTGRLAPNAVNLFATDTSGRLEWYYDPLLAGLAGLPGSNLFPGGTLMVPGRDRHRTLGLNVLREIDLAGNPLRETNIDAVNAQLVASGRDTIYGFHHQILALPGGITATLGWTLRTVQVNGTPTRYAGDMLIVLDKDFQVVWTWNAFDHLDVNRGPVLGELCTGTPCPITGAVDWLHENAIARSADGNLLISIRHQDWVIKIDYADGKGDGHIIWRLGKGGDFAVNSSDPSPWFSHQHNVHYINRSTLIIFDNGNTRQASDPSAHSRGQVWRIDEQAMTATPLLNADLGGFSDSLGSAERLPNGNFVFGSGSQGQPPAQFGQSIEVLPDGTKTYVLEVAAREYRSFRIHDLYRGIRP